MDLWHGTFAPVGSAVPVALLLPFRLVQHQRLPPRASPADAAGNSDSPQCRVVPDSIALQVKHLIRLRRSERRCHRLRTDLADARGTAALISKELTQPVSFECN